jgi:hypothetical protein
MSVNEGTNSTTGMVAPSKRQLVAADNQLSKLLVKSNVAVEKIRDGVMTKIDEVIEIGAWRVSFDDEGKPFDDVKSYLQHRLAPVAALADLVARPVAQRLLLMENDKGKRLFSVREVSETTGVSRGVLNDINQAAKGETREPRPNDGTDSTDENGEPLSEDRIAAVRGIKSHDRGVKVLIDKIDQLTADEIVSVAMGSLSLVSKLSEMYSVAGFGDFKAAIEAAKAEAKAAAEAPAA